MERRLTKLLLVWPAPPASCDACRDWQPVDFVCDDKPPRPEVCPACGRRVPVLSVVELPGIRWASI